MNESLTPQERQQLTELIRVHNCLVRAKEGCDVEHIAKAMADFAQRFADAPRQVLRAFASSHPDPLVKLSQGISC